MPELVGESGFEETLKGFLRMEPGWESRSLVMSEGIRRERRWLQVFDLPSGFEGTGSSMSGSLRVGESWRSGEGDSLYPVAPANSFAANVDILRRLARGLVCDLVSVSVAGVRVDREESEERESEDREKGIRDAREDLLEVMLGNMTRSVA